MKKVLAMLLVLILAGFTVFAGGSQEKTSAAVPTAPVEKRVVPGDPVYIAKNASEITGTVRFWTAFGDALGTGQMVKDFNTYYPNIKVIVNVYPNNTEGNLTCDTALMAGEIDALLSFGTFNSAARWENGLLLNITDKLYHDNLDLVKEWGSDAYVDANDQVFVIPSGGLSVFVGVNMTKWNEAGLGPIPDSWTWDEYAEASRKLTQRDAQGNTIVYGGSDFNQRDYWTYALRQTKGVDALYNADGLSDFDNPLCATILQRLINCADEGIWYNKNKLITDGIKTRDLMWNEQAATGVESIMTRFVMDTNKYPHDFILGYAPYPVNNAGETNYALGNMPNSFFCVAANAQNSDAAYEFIKFASTYGGKYLYKAGHTTTWTHTNPDEIVDLVFGSKEEAAKWVDVDSYIKNVLAVGQPAYHEEYIVAYAEVQSLLDEYTTYILGKQLPVKEGLAELKELADEAIQEKLAER